MSVSFLNNDSKFMMRQRHHVNLIKPINAKAVGNYKKCFSANEIESIERISGNTLRAFGYDLQNNKLAPYSRQYLYKKSAINYLLFWKTRLFSKGNIIFSIADLKSGKKGIKFVGIKELVDAQSADYYT